MIVSLNHQEICTALIEYIGNQGYPVADKKVEVSLTAGRNKKGHTAQLTFEDRPREASVPESTPQDVDDNQQAIKFEFQNPED